VQRAVKENEVAVGKQLRHVHRRAARVTDQPGRRGLDDGRGRRGRGAAGPRVPSRAPLPTTTQARSSTDLLLNLINGKRFTNTVADNLTFRISGGEHLVQTLQPGFTMRNLLCKIHSKVLSIYSTVFNEFSLFYYKTLSLKI
jgi:hypothetical protein